MADMATLDAIADCKHAIQLTEDFQWQYQATEALFALSAQDGYIGGRVIDHKDGRCWAFTVQAFFSDEEIPGGWLPDGCRRVLIPPRQAKALGIRTEAG